MKKRMIYVLLLSTLTDTSMFTACKEADEVPPRRESYADDYVLPAPTFLSSDEREIVEEQRREYQSVK